MLHALIVEVGYKQVAIAGLQRSWQLPKAIAVVMVAKAASVTLDPADGSHGYSNVQLLIEKVGNHAEHRKP